MNRIALLVVFFGLPLFWALGLVIRARFAKQRQTRAESWRKVSVAELLVLRQATLGR